MNAELNTEIRSVLNKHCAENGSNTPDFILADYLLACLDAFEMASNRRERWYGLSSRPGNATPSPVAAPQQPHNGENHGE